MGDKQKAKVLFAEAQKISWDTKPPNVPHRAIELAEAALAEDPDFVEAAALLANDLRRAKDYDKSIEIYKYALGRVSDADSSNYKQRRNLLRDLGRVLVLDSKYEEATGFLEKSLEIEQTSASEYLAEAYSKLGRHQDIINLYSHVEQMSGNGRIVDEPALYLGRAYKALGNKEKAKAIFEAGLRFNSANQEIKDELKNMNGRCFIATATYGSDLAREVTYLYGFRDDVLSGNTLGRSFMHLYYIFSPIFARHIADSCYVRQCVRMFFLSPILRLMRLFYNK